jgi:hypothetical protein
MDRTMTPNRADFQKLALSWIAAAKALLAAKQWGPAYYVAGYSVECGLKSCILVRVAAHAHVIFGDKRYSEKCWTHNLVQLVDLAGLEAVFNADRLADLELSNNWEIVKDWSEERRYLPATSRPPLTS